MVKKEKRKKKHSRAAPFVLKDNALWPRQCDLCCSLAFPSSPKFSFFILPRQENRKKVFNLFLHLKDKGTGSVFPCAHTDRKLTF